VDEAARALVSGLRAGLPAEVAGLPHGYLRPAEWAVEPAPVGMIVFPKARGPDRPLLVGMPIADAATTLLSFSGSLETAPGLALRAAARLTAAAPSYALYAGPLDATVELVSDTAQRLLAAQDNAPSART
jgi:hypothetical protein